MTCETVLLNTLKKQFGHEGYRNDLQKKATEAIYKGNRDIYIRMPSGFGKSLCFQLPIIAKNNSFAIIISPTIAYSKSQTDYLRSKQIPAYSWDAHTPRNIRVQIKNDITSCQPKLKFLYITAEQCTTSHFLFILSKINPKISFYFVIDEAHRISPFSHDFKHSYHELIELREKCPDVPFITLTATATKKIKEDIVETLKMNNPLVCSMPVSRSNISYDIWFTDVLPDPLTHLKEFIETSLGPNNALLSDEIRNCGIIFCENHETTMSLARILTSMGIHTLSYHTRMKIKNRFKVQQLWYSGAVPVITATNSFSIGISKQSVRFVVHWNVHLNIGKYYQQSGRAGHDCKLSYSRAYYQFEEPSNLISKSEETELPLCSCKNEEIYRQNQIDTLVQMKENVTKIECRHVLFSKYFEDRIISCKTLCDICKDENFAKEKLLQFKLFKENTFQSDDMDRILNELQPNFTLDEYGNTRNFSQSTIVDTQQDSQNINDTVMDDSTIIENEISNNSQCRSGINDLLISNKSIPCLHDSMSAEELIQKIQSILYVKKAQKASFPSDSTARCKTRMNDELINNNRSKPCLENSKMSAEELIQKMQSILHVKKDLNISSSPILVEKELIASTQSICKHTSSIFSKDTEVDHVGKLPMTALNTNSSQFETACEDWNSVLENIDMNSTNMENIQSSNFSSFYETAIENPECENFVVNSNSTSFNVNTLHRESTECHVHTKNNMSAEEQLEKIYQILYVKKTKIAFVSTEDLKKVNEYTKKRLRVQDLQESESSGNVNKTLKRQKIQNCKKSVN